jgi:ribosomal protein S18 acetylase RimI-like enzyme
MSDLTLSLSITIRSACQEDIPKLEWFGLMAPFRAILQEDFLRAQAEELAYLVAEINGFPVGQVEADLVRHRGQKTGYIMALRVLPPLQNLGIGTCLMTAVERILQQNGLQIAQLNVEKSNPQALRLYLRLGYQITAEIHQPWSFITPEGLEETIDEPEWVMQKSLKDMEL